MPLISVTRKENIWCCHLKRKEQLILKPTLPHAHDNDVKCREERRAGSSLSRAGSFLAACVLNCPVVCGILLFDLDQVNIPSIARQILSHWTSKEVNAKDHLKRTLSPFFNVSSGMWNFPNHGFNLCPLQQKLRILTTGLARKVPIYSF